ncbi:hypothetical protein ACB092_01G021700 [Castanea dentata]
MDWPVLFLLLSLAFRLPLSFSTLDAISEGTSFNVEKPEDVLISQNGVFSAGFTLNSRTIVWMANRDQPVNGKRSQLSLKIGNLILTDAGKFTIWTTNTISLSSVQLSLSNTGNLVLRNLEDVILWQSFDFPTDTLLPQQLLTRNTKLVSSRSQRNFSTGFYELLFDNDNLLRLLYNVPEVSSIYWFDPWLVSWDADRSTYNNSRIAVLNSLGNFSSSDNFTFMSADYGLVLHRRLTLDYDGNMRLYRWEDEGQKWVVSWQAIQTPCKIHGVCGANSMCSYIVGSGRKCSCLPGYKMKNHADWGYGCEPDFDFSCNKNKSTFLLLSHVEFYGYDYGFYANYTFDQCRDLCLQLCNCKAFQYNFGEDIYLRLPIGNNISNSIHVEEFGLDCSSEGTIQLDRTYVKSSENWKMKFMLEFASGLAGLEIICIFVVWCLLIRTQKNSDIDKDGYVIAANGFRKFTYSALKRATNGFKEEIGRGAGGIVYKGVLSDKRVAAIKRLNEANQGEREFLAEVSIIGRINHMNLIEMWGYCAEGNHRLLVYEYMEHGSLADNLLANSLDWKKRFEIAVGTAKGLAYLHEDCLDWILHCDVKPQNILLDSNYQPKVADFGLSKFQNRNVFNNFSFSKIRGTRGYLAPEWVFNLPITSKVDVYSYGIVLLEIMTGKGPSRSVHSIDDGKETEPKRLVTWVREKKNRAATNTPLLQEIIDPLLEGKYDVRMMETLVEVALQCVEEDKDARPTMNQVVEMLFRQHNYSQ